MNGSQESPGHASPSTSSPGQTDPDNATDRGCILVKKMKNFLSWMYIAANSHMDRNSLHPTYRECNTMHSTLHLIHLRSLDKIDACGHC